MSKKSLFFKISKYIAIVSIFILGLLAFLQKLSTTVMLPMTIIIFFIGIILEALEMYFKKSRNRREKLLYFFRLGLISFCLAAIVVVIIHSHN